MTKVAGHESSEDAGPDPSAPGSGRSGILRAPRGPPLRIWGSLIYRRRARRLTVSGVIHRSDRMSVEICACRFNGWLGIEDGAEGRSSPRLVSEEPGEQPREVDASERPAGQCERQSVVHDLGSLVRRPPTLHEAGIEIDDPVLGNADLLVDAPLGTAVA